MRFRLISGEISVGLSFGGSLSSSTSLLTYFFCILTWSFSGFFFSKSLWNFSKLLRVSKVHLICPEVITSWPPHRPIIQGFFSFCIAFFVASTSNFFSVSIMDFSNMSSHCSTSVSVGTLRRSFTTSPSSAIIPTISLILSAPRTLLSPASGRLKESSRSMSLIPAKSFFTWV